MTGYRPGRYWQYTWRYIGPVIMVCILVSSVVCMVIQNPTYSAWNAAEVCTHIFFFRCDLSSKTRDLSLQAKVEATSYPDWALAIAFSMIIAGVLPMPIVYLLRRFQCLSVDLDIHQGSIRRNETTASTKVMMDDDDVSSCTHIFLSILYKYFDKTTN